MDWELFDSMTDVDSKVRFLTNAMTDTYDLHAPTRVFTPKKSLSPWLTADIRRLMPADPDSFNDHFAWSKTPVTLHDTRPTARISTDTL